MCIRDRLYTGPRTILHNLRKTVERVGIQVDNVIISPLAIVNSVLNEGERESVSYTHLDVYKRQDHTQTHETQFHFTSDKTGTACSKEVDTLSIFD